MARQQIAQRPTESTDVIRKYEVLEAFFLEIHELKTAKKSLLDFLRAAYGETSLNNKCLLSHYIEFNKEMVQLMRAVSLIIRKGIIATFDKSILLHPAGHLRLSLYLPPDRKPATAWEWLPKSLSLDEIADPTIVIRTFFTFKPMRNWPKTFEDLFVSAFSVDSRSASEYLDDLPNYLSMQEHLVKFLEAVSLILMRYLNAETLPSPGKPIAASTLE